ncbi:stage II sporulation protein D [Bacillus sp. FJAT-42376]|uniref:stage II sporulation protein D n=1 Tax=Bacillus sp. FJAT-42376 TaxID=2014076 RepID=UPI000F505570|nr:stage II sporulation protein D [Bacillus sp. FJAT-42376]AZB40880.1 stage II sporulation protein D [Bacillus sp. FJAT-42376]
MKSMKPLLVVLAGLFVIVLMIPALLVSPFVSKSSGQLGEELKQEEKQEKPLESKSNVTVSVYRTAEKKVENVPLEDYVFGVVASEMPADFEEEALKAQALAARTVIVKSLTAGNGISTPSGAKANVTDTVIHQVYRNKEELKKIWGKDYKWRAEKVLAAVSGTAGQILTYENKPITASFFSTSNGYTENSEDYWPNAIPYLRSVKSTWDKESPKYYSQQIFTVGEFQRKLGVKLTSANSVGKVTERTSSHRVAKVEIGGKTLTGRDVRDKLQLKSTDFTWTLKDGNVVIQTKGYGHGVGMSQYGANFMAQDGKSYKDIVSYYYNGTTLAAADPFLTKLTAQQ